MHTGMFGQLNIEDTEFVTSPIMLEIFFQNSGGSNKCESEITY